MFNFKKFVRNKFSQSAPQSGKILNELDQAAAQDRQSGPEEQIIAQQTKKEQINIDKHEATFNSIEAALKEIKDGPFAKVAPAGADKPCEIASQMFENYVTPEEVASFYEQYIIAYQELFKARQNKIDALQRMRNRPQDTQKTPNTAVPQNNGKEKSTESTLTNPATNTMMIDSIDRDINKIIQENNLLETKMVKQQRQYMQYEILYQDMFNYYSLLSRICETETRYDAQVKTFKFGDPEDYRALLSYYEYGIALLQTMAPKAAQVSPGAGENLISYYKSLIASFQAKINELSLAPLKALYGKT
jgi:hypothetical protein